MFEQLARVVLTYPRRVALAFLSVFLLASAGASNLVVDFSVMAFFGGNDPERLHFAAYQEYWGADDNVVLLLLRVNEGDFISKERFARLRTLQDQLQNDEFVEKTFSIIDAALPEPGAAAIDSRPLYERLPAAADELQLFRAQVFSHPIYVPALLAKGGQSAAIFIETTVSSDDVEAVQPLIARLRQLIVEHGGNEGINYALAGIPAVRADFFDAFMRDQSIYLPIGLLLIVLLLLALYRSVHGVLIPGIAALLPVLMTFGVMGWTGEPIGIINQVYTVLLPVIAVADAIHLVSRFHEQARRLAAPGQRLSPQLRQVAIVHALKRIGAACALTSLTTAVGFSSLMVARMPSMQTFGLYAAVGIVLAYGTLLIVIPLMLTFVRAPIPKGGDARAPTPMDKVLLACGHFSVARPLVVLSVAMGIISIFAFFGGRTTVDNNLTALLKSTHPTTQANSVIDHELAGILSLEIDVQGDEGSLIEPEVLLGMLHFADWARSEPTIRAVVSPASFVAMGQQTLTGLHGIPATRAGVAQILLLSESDAGVADILNDERSRARMQVRTQDVGGIHFAELSTRVKAALDEHLGPTGVSYRLTGTPSVAYRGINNVTGDLRDSLVLAFMVIAFIIGVLLKNVRVALVCLLPNAMPLIVGYGLLGMTGWLLEPSGAVIFTVALGIAVDDTLHLVARTREELAAGHSLHDALTHSVLHSGRAVIVTTIILCGGFGVLALSSFPATVILGVLGAVTIFAALVADVLVLPALLSLFGKGLQHAGLQHSMPAATPSPIKS